VYMVPGRPSRSFIQVRTATETYARYQRDKGRPATQADDGPMIGVAGACQARRVRHQVRLLWAAESARGGCDDRNV
jgi:hypothetical protein